MTIVGHGTNDDIFHFIRTPISTVSHQLIKLGYTCILACGKSLGRMNENCPHLPMKSSYWQCLIILCPGMSAEAMVRMFAEMHDGGVR